VETRARLHIAALATRHDLPRGRLHGPNRLRVTRHGRNLAVGALHLLGRRDITEATRWATRSMDRPFKVLKLI